MSTIKYKEIVGSMIEKVRTDKDITIKELSIQTGISEESLSDFEGGLEEIMCKDIGKISLALDVTSDYLLGNIDKETNDIIMLNRYSVEGLFNYKAIQDLVEKGLVKLN